MNLLNIAGDFRRSSRQSALASALTVIGISLMCYGRSSAAIHYVDVASTAPASPYTSWQTAATVIQDAIDAAVDGDEVLVTNGIYSAGGSDAVVGGYALPTNRVSITKRLLVHSVNGARVTIIQGHQVADTINGPAAVRCAYVGPGAVLAGFTLTNGATCTNGVTGSRDGGGAQLLGSLPYLAVISNCIVTGCSADMLGGGLYKLGGGDMTRVFNSLIVGNYARYNSAGAYSCTLINCTVIGNSAFYGPAGTVAGRLTNSIVYFNTANGQPSNCGQPYALSHVCTTADVFLPPDAADVINSDPLFASAGGHLSALSPCRNAGVYLPENTFDLEGQPWANPPSIGCIEFWPSAQTGPLTASISVLYTNIAPGMPMTFVAQIEGVPSASRWDFNDGIIVTNCPFATHAWNEPGSYTVTLSAFNNDHPLGVSTTALIQVQPQSLFAQAFDQAVVLTWSNPAFSLQSAPDLTGTFTNIPGANSPYTNLISEPQRFFRLIGN